MTDAVVGNGDGGEVVLVVTNLGTEPVHLEVGEVLGGLEPVLAVDDFTGPKDNTVEESEDTPLQNNSAMPDTLNNICVAAVGSDMDRERMEKLSAALCLDQLRVTKTGRGAPTTGGGICSSVCSGQR